MPATEANHQAYPQPGSQKPGRGLPVARLVVVCSLACGAVVAAAIGRIKGPQSSATLLCQSLHAPLECDEVIRADRYSGSYCEVALLGGRGIASVMRFPQRRQVALRGGRRVGREDSLLAWPKPKRPAGMDEAT